VGEAQPARLVAQAPWGCGVTEALGIGFGAGLGAALLTGLVFGAGPCNITCLPYLGPVLLSQAGGVRRGLATVLPFSLGRLTGYALLGGVAGYAGERATRWIEQGPAAWLLGGAAVLLGLLLIRRAGRAPTCTAPTTGVQPVTFGAPPRGAKQPLGLFGLGLGMACNPCVPLASVLAVSAAGADPWLGLALGLAFGLGAVLVPTLLFGLLVAHFGAQVREQLAEWRSALERTAGGLLIAMGTLTAMGWIQP